VPACPDDEVAAVDGVRAGWDIEDDVLVQATAIGASMSEADKHRLEKLISQLCDPTDGCPAEYYRDAFPIQYSVALTVPRSHLCC
jgi:hypothetical protein